jgi:hypothetical protein
MPRLARVVGVIDNDGDINENLVESIADPDTSVN